MLYSVVDIIRDVRMTLDENQVSTSILIADSDNLSLDEIIRSKIVDATRSVSEAAPVSMLWDAKPFPHTNIEWGGAAGIGMCTINLPVDFLRLVAFQMSDWVRPVSEPINDTDTEYYIQKSKFAGVRGNVNKPICAIIPKDNHQALEAYSCEAGSKVTVKTAQYIPIPTIVDDSIEICKMLYSPIVYYIAALTATTYKDTHAESLFTISKNYLE